MSKKTTKVLASATLMSLVLTTALTAGPVKAAAGQVTRTGGADRYETAAKVATANWTSDNTDDVILVNGLSYADSVSASALAKKLGAPILLTGADSLNANAKSALDTLKPKNVYIIGGTGAVSQTVENSLSDYTVTRLSGANRYSTNLAVANKLVDLGVSKDNLLVVTGQAYSDALSAAPVAAAKGEILLLSTNDKTAMQPTYDFAKDSNVTVIGTTYSVDAATYTNLAADSRVDGGANRFETNINILKAFDSDLKADYLYAATAKANGSGANDTAFADALVASAVAGKNSAPLVLLGSSDSDAGALDYIGTKATKTTDLQVVGGTGAVSDATVSAINEKVNPTPVFDGEVTSVETVADQTVNANADDETLQFTVNGGQKVSVDDLNEAGYIVTFTANEDVFGTKDDQKDTSDDGILTKDNLKDVLNGPDNVSGNSDDVDSFKYRINITKDGVDVASTSYETVDIISGDETATSISDVTLKDSTTKGKITSGKIVKDEDSVYVDKVKGALVNGSGDVTVTNLDYSSSNPWVATVDEDGKITILDTGKFNLIVKSGSSTKEVPLEVVSEARKAKTAAASVSSLSLANDAVQNFDITLKDQYGDAFADKEVGPDFTASTTDFAIDTSITSGGDKIATVTPPTAPNDKTDKDGKLIGVKVTADSANTGSSSLNVKNTDGLSILKLPVKVVDEATTSSWKIEPKDSDSKSLTLDLNPQSNDETSVSTDKLTLNINKYTSSGALGGQADLSDYTIKIKKSGDNTDLNKYIAIDGATVDTSGNVTGASGTDLVITPADYATAKVGTVQLVITNNDSDSDNYGASKTINITTKDSSPVVTGSSTLKDKTITTTSGLTDTNISDIVDVDKLVLNGSKAYGDGKVRLATDGTLFINVKTSDELSGTTETGTYADVDDSNVKYDAAQDVTVGKVKVGVAADKGDLDTVSFSTSTGDITAVLKSGKTKGKFTVAITSPHDSAVIVSKDVNIDTTAY